MAQHIHKTAVIDPSAKIADGVSIGPFCVIGADVELAEGVNLHAHVCIEGQTYIGAQTEISPYAVVGCAPQHHKYRGENTRVAIGARCAIREHVTIHRGMPLGGGLTKIGDDCLLMVGVHIAHDCTLGDHCTLANSTALGGHVSLGDHVVLGGLTAVPQFIRIGQHAFCGAGSLLSGDVIPYGLVAGSPAILQTLNLVGLKRRGFAAKEISALRAAFRVLFRGDDDDTVLMERVHEVAKTHAASACVQQLTDFMLVEQKRGYCLPK